MHDAITTFLNTSTYHPCLLLVHLDVRRLEDAASDLISTYGWPRLSVGQELGATLSSEPSARRSRVTRRRIETRLREIIPASGTQATLESPSPILCTEIDLLFEPTLQLDPLKLLRDASRANRIIVTWPGSYADNILAYAVPKHSHYRTWRRPGVAITCL
jgi:hypothetical protein